MNSSKRTVGLFGGTFDPVHNGHLSIAKAYLESDFINELWVMLTPEPPHKKKLELSSFAYRKKMLQITFNQFSDIRVKDIEYSLPTPSYTIQTILYLKKMHPHFRFYLCIGEDSLVHFKKWHLWRQILEECELLVADRPNFSMENLDSVIAARTKLVQHKSLEISSSEIRRRVMNEEDIKEMVPPGVKEFIISHHLYKY